MAELTTLARPYAKAAFEYAKENSLLDEWEALLLLASRIVSDVEFQAFIDDPAIAYQQKATLLIDICTPQEASADSPVKRVLDSVNLPQGFNVDALIRKITPRALTMEKSTDQAFVNFINQLAENDRLPLLLEIQAHYSKLKSQALKRVDAYVTSAYPLAEAQKQLLQEKLSAREQATVVLHESVDQRLLGGITIKIGDKFTDGSVRGKLQQLKTQLMT